MTDFVVRRFQTEAVVLEWNYGCSMWENSVRVTVWGMHDPDSVYIV
jgi:hypothetical protein